MDHEQNSNHTRPSTNHSHDHFQPQTNTSEHNPIVSQSRISQQNLTQHEIQSISLHQPRSQKINNNNGEVEQNELSANQRPVSEQSRIKNQIVPKQRNQLQTKNYHFQLQKPQESNIQKLESKSEQELLMGDYNEAGVNGPSNLNDNHAEDNNQNNEAHPVKSEPILNSQAQTDLLDFGQSLEVQNQSFHPIQIHQNKVENVVLEEPLSVIKDEPMDIQTRFKQDKGMMEIESESKGYLTQKQSHKCENIYNQRQKEWEVYEPTGNQSEVSNHEQIPFYEQKIPQNNSNLFMFGFTVTKKNSSEIKTPNQQPQKQVLMTAEKNQQLKQNQQTSKDNAQNQENIQTHQIDNKEPQSCNIVIAKSSPQKNSQQSIPIQPVQQQEQQIHNIGQSEQKVDHVDIPLVLQTIQTHIVTVVEVTTTQKQVKVDEIIQTNHQVKDQLPSQIQSDQFQAVSDKFKDKQTVPIDFESISGIYANDKPNEAKNIEAQIPQSNNNYQPENQDLNKAEFVLSQLKNIHKNKDAESEQVSFRLLQSLVKTHINLITLTPIDSIGQTILQNGQYTILFIDLFALNSRIPEDRKLFQKYLTVSLLPNIKENRQVFQEYKLKFWPRKSDRFTITDNFNLKSSPKKEEPEHREEQEQHDNDQNYSVQVHNTSGHQGQRSIMKSKNKSKVKEPRTEMPVKRSPADLQVSANSHSNDKQTKQVASSYLRNKKIKETKRRVILKEQPQEHHEKLGMAETFVTVGDKYGNQVLKTRKVSLRLLEKANRQKSNSKQIKQQHKTRSKKKSPKINESQPQEQQVVRRNSPKRSASKKAIRKSVQKTQGQEQILTVDYIKSHFQELKIDTSQLHMLSHTLLTQADKQIAKMLEQLQKAQRQQERLALDLEEQSQHRPPIEQSQRSYNVDQDSNYPVSLQRIREIQQQLQKSKLKRYKIMQQLTQKHIVIETVIDPDINKHGIYALVKVSKMTAVFCGARYFLIPMSKLEFCSRDKIDQDIKTIKSLVQESERENIGLLKPTSKIQEAIQAQKRRRAKQQIKNKNE